MTAAALKVSEVFCSPQGEGVRAGEMSVFVRLQGCSAKHACFQSGVVCDTEFESGREVEVAVLLDEVAALACPWVIFTGGEPLDQLTPGHAEAFRRAGYRLAIETSGVRPFPQEFRAYFDWIACSPKVAEHVLLRHFGAPGLHLSVPATAEPEHDGRPNLNRMPVAAHVHELRYVRHVGQALPQPALTALAYCLSPHSDGVSLNGANARHVVALCRQDPRWRVSLQLHKVLGVL